MKICKKCNDMMFKGKINGPQKATRGKEIEKLLSKVLHMLLQSMQGNDIF